MIKGPIRGIVFDFDGTLTELTLDFGHLRKEVEEVARAYISDDFIRRLDGLYIIEMIYEIEGELGGRGNVFRKEAFRRLCEAEIRAADGKEVFPYTRDVLRSLQEKGIKIGIMTRNCIGALRKAFHDIDDYVQAVVTRDDVPQVKPNPGHAAAVLARIGVEANEAVLVGDHPTDILVGIALNVRTVGVLTGRTGRDELQKTGAHCIINDIREIAGLLSCQTQ
jgi:phosphoglycolate phosphatase